VAKRSIGWLMAALLLASCGGAPKHRPAQSWSPPPSVDTPGAFRQCLADLGALSAKFEALPDRNFANGCSATSAVKLVAIGVPVTNLGALKCGAALALTKWVQQAVQSAAHDRFNSYVVKIESFGSFACRPVNNVAGNKLSEHGHANAVDIAGFVIDGGVRVTVKDDWNGPDAAKRAFLRQVRDAACRRFNIVLSPDANAFHHDHLHFDMGNGHVCH
jgi:hypothetical protein